MNMDMFALFQQRVTTLASPPKTNVSMDQSAFWQAAVGLMDKFGHPCVTSTMPASPSSDTPADCAENQWPKFARNMDCSACDVLGYPDEVTQYLKTCSEWWQLLRKDFTLQIQAAEWFVERTGLGLPKTMPLYPNSSLWFSVEHHPGYCTLLAFFVTNFEISLDEITGKATKDFGISEENMSFWLNQLTEYIHIPKRFFYKHDPTLYRPQAMFLYARYLYRRYYKKTMKD